MEKEKSQLITVRVFFKLDVKLVTLSKLCTLEYLQERALEEFKIEDKNLINNLRLRAYKPNTDTMMDTYTGKYQDSLESLKIGHFKNVCIETKLDSEEFEEYGTLLFII